MEQTKQCPYCGEEIPIKATRCKYCQEILEEQNDYHTTVTEEKKSSFKVPKLVKKLFAAFVIAIIFFIIKIWLFEDSKKDRALLENIIENTDLLGGCVGSWEGATGSGDHEVKYQIDIREDGTASANINGFLGGEEYAMGKYYIDYIGQMTGFGHWTKSEGRYLIKWENHTKRMHIDRVRSEGFNIVERNEHSTEWLREFNQNPADFYYSFPNYCAKRIDDNTITITDLTPEGNTSSYKEAIVLKRIPE